VDYKEFQVHALSMLAAFLPCLRLRICAWSLISDQSLVTGRGRQSVSYVDRRDNRINHHVKGEEVGERDVTDLIYAHRIEGHCYEATLVSGFSRYVDA
jgi:hypothetical protein